jgi:hypothetical protein
MDDQRTNRDGGEDMNEPAWAGYVAATAFTLAGLVFAVGGLISDWSRWPAANYMGMGMGLIFILVGVRGFARTIKR